MFLIKNSHRENKYQARPGWLCAWYSRPRGVKRRRPGGFRKLRCEMLERRELLSASVVPGAQARKTIDFSGNASRTSSQFGSWTVTGNASISISYADGTGTLRASGTGTITSPPGYGTLTAIVSDATVTPDASQALTPCPSPRERRLWEHRRSNAPPACSRRICRTSLFSPP